MLNIRLNLKSPTLHKTSWQYPLKIYLDADDEFDTKVENMRMQDHASFVKANPWPEEKLIMDYIKNHFIIKPYIKSCMIGNDGAKFYRHDLAKALWHIGSLSNNIDEKMSAYRNVGWKIKAFCEEIASKSEVLKCMQFYYYLQKDVLLGNDVITTGQ